jgi:hypothetical protein
VARTDAYRNVDRFCLMCKKVIPADRKSDAITCSTECTKRRADFLRSKIDQKECRYCNKPSTPEDRVFFSQWKKAMRKGMADEDFNAQVIETTRLVREVERLKRRLAELAPEEKVNG